MTRAPEGSQRARRRRLDRLLVRLLEAESEERPGLLDEITEPELRAELELLLSDALREDDFLRPAGALVPELVEAAGEAFSEPDRVGLEIGPYRLLRILGRGGMGEVYLAERVDGRFDRRVALKILRLDGALADRRRFLREQQILADLVHPGIARLYDGGVSDEGEPWFVMEYVEGEPIDEHCEREDLGPRARLELVVEVCRAAESAHRRLVVHRDLKPSNILVDADGRPRLLDFGIASVEEAAREAVAPAEAPPASFAADRPTAPPLATVGGPSRLTIQYASPEQLRGDAVTVASDVFQLGLLLYELLAGERPHDLTGLSLEEARERIAGPVPALSERLDGRPSVDGDGLPRRDLDAVVRKALAFDPEDRHIGAASLRRDLERLLAGRPVSALPNELPYRIRRFVGRHPLGVWSSAAAVSFFLVVIGVFTSRLAAERDATREEARRAEESLRFVTDLFRQAGPERGAGPDTTARELLAHGVDRLRGRLDDRPRTKARILVEIGSMYETLGEWDTAESLLREGLELRREWWLGSGDAPRSEERLAPEGVADLADSRLRLGRLHRARGDLETATTHLEKALEGARRLDRRELLAAVSTELGKVRRLQGRLAEAETHHRRALEIREHLGDRQGLAGEQLNLATVLARRGDRTESRRLLEESLETFGELRGAEHVTVATALQNLATLEAEAGDPEKAIPLLDRALDLQKRIRGPRHPEVARTLANLGNALARVGRHEAARERLDEAASIYRELPGEHFAEGSIQMNLGVVAAREGDAAAAEKRFRRALEVFREHLTDESREIPLALYNLGESVREQGRPEEALPLLEESRELFRRSLGPDHLLLSFPLLELARTRAALGDLGGAAELAERALEIRRTADGVDPALIEEADRVRTELWSPSARDR